MSLFNNRVLEIGISYTSSGNLNACLQPVRLLDEIILHLYQGDALG